jgi:hypothetical protein
MLWPDERRVRYAAIRERMTSEEGKRMRCSKGALHAHAVMRAEGRTPGDEGRAAIMWNRAARKRDREEGKGWRVGHTVASQFEF